MSMPYSAIACTATGMVPEMDPAHASTAFLTAGGGSCFNSTHVGNREPPARLQHPKGLAEDGSLVLGQLDHAVEDHDVDRTVGERNLLDGALEEDRVLPGWATQRIWRSRPMRT